jgi:hypothetical protein
MVALKERRDTISAQPGGCPLIQPDGLIVSVVNNTRATAALAPIDQI